MTLNLSLKSSCLGSLIAEIADGHHNKSYRAGDQTQGFTHAGQELNHWGKQNPCVLWAAARGNRCFVKGSKHSADNSWSLSLA